MSDEVRTTKIVAVANQKGGVGKTTTAINLASCVAAAGLDVLLIDMDPQGNSSSGVGFERELCEVSIYHALVGERTVDEIVYATDYENLLLVPSTTDLGGCRGGTRRSPAPRVRVARGALVDVALF